MEITRKIDSRHAQKKIEREREREREGNIFKGDTRRSAGASLRSDFITASADKHLESKIIPKLCVTKVSV